MNLATSPSTSEHVAWKIRDLAEAEDFLWPCFSPELTNKMNHFCFAIV